MHAPTATAAGSATPPLPALPLQFRPVSGADQPAMQQFLQGLSSSSRRLRFHGGINPQSARLLAQLTQADGHRHIAWVAVAPAGGHAGQIVGEARCMRAEDGTSAEFAVAVADAWQGAGVAGPLLAALLADARRAGITRVVGDVLARNGRIAGFMQREGFVPVLADDGDDADDDVQRWQRLLPAPQPARRPALPRVRAWAAASLPWPLRPVAAGWRGWLASRLALQP